MEVLGGRRGSLDNSPPWLPVSILAHSRRILRFHRCTHRCFDWRLRTSRQTAPPLVAFRLLLKIPADTSCSVRFQSWIRGLPFHGPFDFIFGRSKEVGVGLLEQRHRHLLLITLINGWKMRQLLQMDNALIDLMDSSLNQRRPCTRVAVVSLGHFAVRDFCEGLFTPK